MSGRSRLSSDPAENYSRKYVPPPCIIAGTKEDLTVAAAMRRSLIVERFFDEESEKDTSDIAELQEGHARRKQELTGIHKLAKEVKDA